MDSLLASDTNVKCDVCKGYQPQYGVLQAPPGCGASDDDERYLVHLCKYCFFGALSYLRQQRRIKTMFDDDQPTDNDDFGLAPVMSSSATYNPTA